MNKNFLMTCALAMILIACTSSKTETPKTDIKTQTENTPKAISALPADHFDLSHWNITVPLDQNNDGKVDIVKNHE